MPAKKDLAMTRVAGMASSYKPEYLRCLVGWATPARPDRCFALFIGIRYRSLQIG